MSSNKFIQLSDWHECYVVFNEKFCMIQCNYPLPQSLVYSSDLIWTWQFNNRWWNLHSFNFHGLKPLVCFFQNKNSTYIYVIKFIQCFWRRSKKCKKKKLSDSGNKEQTNIYWQLMQDNTWTENLTWALSPCELKIQQYVWGSLKKDEKILVIVIIIKPTSICSDNTAFMELHDQFYK